jgi:hypothetical protein
MPREQRPILQYQTPASPVREDFPWGTVSFALGLGAVGVVPIFVVVAPRLSDILEIGCSASLILSLSATVGAFASGAQRWRAIIGVALVFAGFNLLVMLSRG